MAKSITEVAITNTFQNWLDKTNELVDLVNNDILTASPAGDTTTGNATLNGNFTATDLTANTLLRTNTISPKVGSTSILSNAPFNITASQKVCSLLTSAEGPRIAFNDTEAGWQIGFQNTTTKNFVISATGEAGVLRLNRSGDLEVSGTITSQDFAGNLKGDIFASDGTKILENGNGINPAKFTGNVKGDVEGTVSSLSNLTTGDLAEGGSNQYFTIARARNAISPGTGVTFNKANGEISIGQAVEENSNVTFNSMTSASISIASGKTTVATTGAISTTSTIFASGAISSGGDITAFASSSDIRKKENIKKIDNALDKILQISGYTYNFKGDDRKITGVIAQEIEKVLPEVVYEIDDEDFGGKTKAVRYGNIVGLLIEAIKDLNSEIKELKKSK